MVIAVDFDGTLFTNAWPNIGEPIWPIINYCKHKKLLGDTLILWTCRSKKDLKEAIAACKSVGLIFDYVNDNTDENKAKYRRHVKSNRKINADLYIDDKAISTVQLIETLGDNERHVEIKEETN